MIFGKRKEENSVDEETDLFGYVERHGMFPIGKVHPFNEVDAVVLCRISYLSLEGIIGEDFGKGLTIKEIAIEYSRIKNATEMGTYDKKDFDLLNMLRDSKRFSSMKVSGFRSSFSLKKTEQFAACTIQMDTKRCFISFRGTDSTLNGWKEDFDLGILGNIPSHATAMKYCREAMAHFPSRKFIFGGHSKGGNLASFVAMSLPKNIRDTQFEGAYIIDGPGFRKDVLVKGNYKSIADKVVALSPTQSIIGMILYSPFKVCPVKSRNFMVLQHDVYVWRIKGNEFVRSSFEPISYATKRWTVRLFESMNVGEIEYTIDLLFEFMDKEFGSSVSSMFEHPWLSIFAVAGKIRVMEPKEKETLTTCWRLFSESMRSCRDGYDSLEHGSMIKPDLVPDKALKKR